MGKKLQSDFESAILPVKQILVNMFKRVPDFFIAFKNCIIIMLKEYRPAFDPGIQSTCNRRFITASATWCPISGEIRNTNGGTH